VADHRTLGLGRAALAALDLSRLRANGYAFQVEVNYACARAGLRFAEVPIVFPNRARGSSKMSGHIVLEAALLVLRLRLGSSDPALSPLTQPSGVAQQQSKA